jgi:ankyrin repeat protein
MFTLPICTIRKLFPSLNFIGVVFPNYHYYYYYYIFWQFGHTALIEAASSDANYAIVKLLLEAGANMEAKDEV